MEELRARVGAEAAARKEVEGREMKRLEQKQELTKTTEVLEKKVKAKEDEVKKIEQALEIQRTSQLNKSAKLTSARDQEAALQLQWAETEVKVEGREMKRLEQKQELTKTTEGGCRRERTRKRERLCRYRRGRGGGG